jgi:RNA-directed DNA polymerase
MKTYKNLYSQVTAFETLYQAYRLARRGKRDRAAVADFEFDLEHNLLDLQAELQSQTYLPGGYHNFYIYEPKRRLVSAAPFRDRVVHHALCQIIEPIWETRFIQHSYACRVGKGTQAALTQTHALMRQYRYVFHGDIVKYFPSIDHEILYALIARRIADPYTLWLIQTILNSGAGIQANAPLMYGRYPTGLPTPGEKNIQLFTTRVHFRSVLPLLITM